VGVAGQEPQRGRPRKFDRVQALRCAMKTFWELGYEGASLTDLTDAMGINSASLYNAFGSKEELFREAIAYYAENDGGATDRALAQAPTAREAIEGILTGNLDLFADPDTPMGCMIVLSAMNYNARNRGVRDFLVERRRQVVTLLEQRLERAIAEGELPAKTDVKAVASFYSTVLNGLSIEARDGATPAQLKSTVDTAMSLWTSMTL
jgi:AcrR family transcriptional regulator